MPENTREIWYGFDYLGLNSQFKWDIDIFSNLLQKDLEIRKEYYDNSDISNELLDQDYAMPSLRFKKHFGKITNVSSDGTHGKVEVLVNVTDKGWYRIYFNNKSNVIVGLQIKPEFPKKPNIIINNDFSKSIKKLSDILFKKIIQN